jgi:hypothetical protein
MSIIIRMVPDSYYFKYENQPHNTAICTPSSIKQLPRQRFYKFSSDQLLPSTGDRVAAIFTRLQQMGEV